MVSLILNVPKEGRRGLRRAIALVLTLVGTLTALAVFALPAFAEQKVPTFEISKEQAPALDYSLVWWQALASLGLLVAFLIMLFVLSEKEFKGVVNERFGPKR